MTDYKHTRQGYADALIELAPGRPELLVLDADVAKATKTCDFEKKFPDRFFNCGTQEQNMLSVAAGLALEGFVPFATTFAMFITTRAADQLRNSIAYPGVNVKLAGTHGGVTTGGDGASHQACEDIAIARALPNLTVLVPGDYEESRQATLAAAAHVGPVYLRFGRDPYPVVPALHGPFVIGQAKRLRPGHDITLCSTGIMAHEALLAAEELDRAGVSARVLHFPTIKPLDVAAVVEAATETRGLVTVEEHSILGGLGEAIAGVLAERHPAPMRRVGMPDIYGQSGHGPELLDFYGLRAAQVAEAARRLLAGRP